MESLVAVDQAVFAGKAAPEVARVVLQGALTIGTYRGGLLLLLAAGSARIVAASGEAFSEAEGRQLPAELAIGTTSRLRPEVLADIAPSLSSAPPTTEVYAIPVATDETQLGTLLLLDPDGDTPDDHLMDSYASRAAAALQHVLAR
jgi:hypothetical protein